MADTILEKIRAAARPVSGGPKDWDPLLQMTGDARLVLIGEASHGTHEFYSWRADITKRLIVEKGFNAVAVEADWPDAYRVNRYVRGLGEDREPVESLGSFRRFPTWMWRNADVLDFVGWLRDHNDEIPENRRKVGFYGVDLYSLFRSIEAVIEYLDRVDPEAAQRARERYSCFEMFEEDSTAYGYAASFGMSRSCQGEVLAQLVDFQRRASEYAQRNGSIPPDEAFFAEQNARLVRNAEEYYRSMFSGRGSSWNLRDTHMADTVDALAEHLARQRMEPKIVVWEHNSHLGDARATEMGRRGEINVGQLARERHGDAVRNIGFTTHEGSVTASTDWDGPAERKRVRPSMEGSWERLFHECGTGDFLLLMDDPALRAPLAREQLERAIGVIYRPETERMSHYFHASLSRQFDAVIHVERSRAVEPLERWEIEHTEEIPETYPSAL